MGKCQWTEKKVITNIRVNQERSKKIERWNKRKGIEAKIKLLDWKVTGKRISIIGLT